MPFTGYSHAIAVDKTLVHSFAGLGLRIAMRLIFPWLVLLTVVRVGAQVHGPACYKDLFVRRGSGQIMAGANFTVIGRVPFPECRRRCQAEKGFRCTGIEFHAPTATCRLMKTPQMRDTQYRPATLWFHFERFCLRMKAFLKIHQLYGPIAVRMGDADFMVCADTWEDQAARATCRAFGHPEGFAVSDKCDMPIIIGLQRPENRTFHKISCSGQENSLLDCKGELDGNPCPRDSYGSVKCLPSRLEVDNDEMVATIRTYANTTNNWGFVEIRHLGYRVTICEISDTEAKVICKQNGFNDGIALHVSPYNVRTADFALREHPFSIRKLVCPSNARTTRRCQVPPIDCPKTPFCHTNGFAHVLCTNNQVFDGDVRLRAGSNSHGRVEYRFNGLWGTILSNENWTPAEATVVCNELGYGYGVPRRMEYPTSRPVWFSDVYCSGTEDSIIGCRLARGWNNPHPLSLRQRRDAWVTCDNNIQYRLAGGNTPNRGRVELKLTDADSWGAVCKTQWGDLDTKVLCRQLGYVDGKVLEGLPFGRTSNDILLDEVECDGTEDTIMGCSHKPFGVHNCSQFDILSVECTQDTSQGNTEITLTGGDPEFIFVRRPQNITAEIGTNRVLMQCKTSKRANIRWKLNGRLISQSNAPSGIRVLRGGVLMVRYVQGRHAGLYECEASKIGEIDIVIRAHAWLTVPTSDSEECAEHLDESPNNITARLGSEVLFTCFSEMPNNITWFKDDVAVVQDGRHEVLANGYLSIKRVARGDQGSYICHVRMRMQAGRTCETRASGKLFVFADISEVCGQPVVNQPRRSANETVDRGYVVGGQEALPGSAPWQVMIVTRPRLWKPTCGGVIINERVVITAAHCIRHQQYPVESEEDVKVKVGKHMRIATDKNEVTDGVSAIAVHDNFDINNFNNDIVILLLRTPIIFTDYVRPICVGSEEQMARMVRPERFGTLTGWGRLGRHDELPGALNEVRIPVVDRNTCRLSTRHPFTENMFCAGFGQALRGDSCKGDSGSPFSMEDAGRWYLVGLVSWGAPECGAEGQYGYYTNIMKFREWIINHEYVQSSGSLS